MVLLKLQLNSNMMEMIREVVTSYTHWRTLQLGSMVQKHGLGLEQTSDNIHLMVPNWWWTKTEWKWTSIPQDLLELEFSLTSLERFICHSMQLLLSIMISNRVITMAWTSKSSWMDTQISYVFTIFGLLYSASMKVRTIWKTKKTWLFHTVKQTGRNLVNNLNYLWKLTHKREINTVIWIQWIGPKSHTILPKTMSMLESNLGTL